MQFIDEFKRAILQEGGYCPSLGPEPVEAQVMIVLGVSSDKLKVQKRPEQQNLFQKTRELLQSKSNFPEAPPVPLEEEDDESESDEYCESLESSDSEGVTSPQYRHSDQRIAKDSSLKAKGQIDNSSALPYQGSRHDESLPLPRSREEEKQQFAQALRESSKGALSSGSLRRPDAWSEPAPLPPPRSSTAGIARIRSSRLATEQLEEADVGPSALPRMAGSSSSRPSVGGRDQKWV